MPRCGARCIDKPVLSGYTLSMTDLVKDARMDKTAFSVATLSDDSHDREYWLSRTPEQRLETLELLRMIHYGYDPATTRLQRLLEVVELGGG